MEANVDPLCRGPDWKPITPKRGSFLHADSQRGSLLLHCDGLAPSTSCRSPGAPRLDGWPMRSPVNASPRPSRATAHDLGPMWIATPSSQGTFTLYSLPVSRRFAYLVRFTPVSDRRADIRNRQLRAISRHRAPPDLFGK